MSQKMSQVISTIYDAKMSLYVPLNVLVNVPVKEYEGRLTVKSG